MVICAVQNRVPFLPSRRISLKLSHGVNEDSTEIVDVHEGWAGHEVIEATEKLELFVVGEKGGRIEAERMGLPRRGAALARSFPDVRGNRVGRVFDTRLHWIQGPAWRIAVT